MEHNICVEALANASHRFRFPGIKQFVQRFSSLLPRVNPTYRTGPVGISALAEESKRIGDAP